MEDDLGGYAGVDMLGLKCWIEMLGLDEGVHGR